MPPMRKLSVLNTVASAKHDKGCVSMRLFCQMGVKTIRHALFIVFRTIQPRHTAFHSRIKVIGSVQVVGHFLRAIGQSSPPRQPFGLASFLDLIHCQLFKHKINHHGKNKQLHAGNGHQPQEA
jgi:hypothetical protein